MAQPVLALFDSFFKDPETVFRLISSGPFEDYKSAWDGVVYPGINKDIPNLIASHIEKRLAAIVGAPIVVGAMFARVMTKGMKAPHRIHSDRIMGQYSCHIYLSHIWEGESGTSFWTHESEGSKHTDSTDVEKIQNDQADLTKWTRNIVMLGKFNRAILHDATMFHSAEPGEGWGDGPLSGRLVLTTFFSEAK